MSLYTINPTSGDDTNDGIAAPVRSLRRLTKVLEQRGPGGHEVLLTGGANHNGELRIVGGSPEEPLRITSTDPTKPYQITAGAGRVAILVLGQGGLTISHGKLIGDSYGYSDSSGVEFANGHLVNGPARGITLEHLEAVGFGMAGIAISAFDTIESIILANCNLHGNANGLFLSGASGTGVNLIRQVHVRDTVAKDNTLFHRDSCGNGMSLVGVDGLDVIGCNVFGNGQAKGTTGSGITAQQCRRVEIKFNHVGGTPEGTLGDGQGIVLNDCEESMVEHNTSTDDHIGIAVHDDRQYHPGYLSRRIVVRNNLIRGASVGLQVFRTRGDVWLTDNEVSFHARAGEYRKCIDTYGPHDGKIYILRNTLSATSAEGWKALMLEAAGPGGLRNVEFGERNLWMGGYRVWKVGDSYYGSLEEALAAVPVEPAA